MLTAALAREGEVIVQDKQGVAGFSIKRAFGRGSIIGPFIAAHAATARALIGYWLKRSSGAFIRVDLTGEHGLAGWLTQIGLSDAALQSRWRAAKHHAPEMARHYSRFQARRWADKIR